jgi:hypothetical protein
MHGARKINRIDGTARFGPFFVTSVTLGQEAHRHWSNCDRFSIAPMMDWNDS